MIDRDAVRHVAALARLKLSEEELTRYEQEMKNILDYVGELSALDVAQVEPTTHTAGAENVFHTDEATVPGEELQEALVSQFPSTKDNYLLVQRVLHHDHTPKDHS